MRLQTFSSSDDAASRWYYLFAIAAGAAVFVMAWHNRLTFPYPWNDEARFYLPSWYFSQTGSLNPKILNAPAGIYWVPDGFYVWLGIFLALFGRSITVARTVCELSVAASVTFFALVLRKITQSSWMAAIFTCILLAPPVIFAANMVRMESAICLFFSIALWLHLRGATIAAGSLLLLSILFHPAPALAFAAYAVAAYIRRGQAISKKQPRWELWITWSLLTVVVIAFAVEIGRIAMHFDLFRQHMSYQETRKASTNHLELLFKPNGILLGVELGTMLVWLFKFKQKIPVIKSDLLPVIAATLGIQAYAVLGGEAVYDVYNLSIGPAIFLALFYRIGWVKPA
jgi:hypothetical protein